MKVIIDRFEGSMAIVEISEDEYAEIPRRLVPDAHEGDVIDISIDRKETEARTERIKELQDNLFED